MKRRSTEDFINKAKEVHGDRYDYSQSEYLSSEIKISVLCREHGVFLQKPYDHLRGRGCRFCGYNVLKALRSQEALESLDWNFAQPEEYKLIPLTEGKFAKVDNEDFEKLKKIKWHYSKEYARNAKHGAMHRFLLQTPEGYLTDHENGDTLDNRKSNLRLATSQENSWNSKPKEGCKSSHKGVCPRKDQPGLWRARITYKGKTYYLGDFKSELKAAEAYNKKAKELYKEFAKLNKI